MEVFLRLHLYPDQRVLSGVSRDAAGAVALRLKLKIGYGVERYRPPRR